MTRDHLTPADAVAALNASDYAHAAEQVDERPPAYLCEQCGHYFRPLVPPRACPRCGNAARTRRQRARRGLLTAATLAALAIMAPAALGAQTPGQVIGTIAPGGNIRAVLAATDDLGWPHAPTVQERRAVTRLVLASVVGRRAGAVRCYFGPSMGTSYCGVNVAHRSQPPKPGRTDRFRVDVKVWEDGSYAILYPATRAGGR